jgi:hypothetical protein
MLVTGAPLRHIALCLLHLTTAFMLWSGVSAPHGALAQSITHRSTATATSPAGLISYAGAGAVVERSTQGALNPPFPAGSEKGDLMIVHVLAREDNNTTITMPNWNLLMADSAGDYRVSAFWRVLDGSAQDTNQINWAGANRLIMARMSRFTGADRVSPILGAGTVTSPTQIPATYWRTQAANNARTGSLTTSASSAMLVILAMNADDSSPDTPPGACGVLPAFTSMNEGYVSTTTTDRDGALWLYYQLQSTAGAKGDYCQGQDKGNDRNTAILLALNPTVPPSAITIDKPAGTVENDVMIASIASRPCSNSNGGACTKTITPPAGWTLVRSIDQTGGGGTGGFGNILDIFRKVATAAEPSTYTWAFSGTPIHAGAIGTISSFFNVDITSPVVTENGQATGNSYNHTAPSIDTGAVTDTMLVSSFVANSGATWTVPVGMTKVSDASSLPPTDDLGLAMAVSYQFRGAASGPTGVRTATHSNPPASDTGAAHMLALRPMPTLNHFSISHAGSGVGCDQHTITITAHNAAHQPVSAAGSTVTLSTTHGRGTWTGIVAGGGTLFGVGVGNGSASYTFAAGSSAVQLSFRYADLSATSETFGFNVSGGGYSETTGTANAGDDPSFTMAQAGFRFRNIEDGNSTILTQISGKPSNTGFNSRTVRLQAIRTDTVTGSCVGLFASQTRAVELGAECNSPATCAARQVSINGSNIATSNDNGGVGALGYTNVSLAFNANSEADTVITYPDAGQISLHARFDLDAGVAGYEMIGSSNPFVVRPFGLTFPGIAHSNTATGAVLAAAGDNFALTVRAYQWAAGEDANNDGIPDAGVNITDNGTVPNFAATAVVGRSANLPGVALGAVSRGAGCAGAATIALAGGTATAADWCYSEAGNVILTADVASYITAGVNITGTSGLDGGGSGGYVGRFRAKRFAVSGATRVNRAVASCAPGSAFTYMDEGLTLAFTLTAQNTQGATTQNYTGAYARLDPTAGGSNNSKTAFDIGARNVVPFAALTARVSGAYVTSAPAWVNGVLNVTGSNAALVTVTRPTPDDPPDGPYAQVQFGIAPVDPDGVLMATYDLDVDNSAGNDHAITGATTEIRYGRLRLGGANGSQLLPLQIPVEAQYWNGAFFVTNADDSCTALAANNVGLGNYLGNLDPGETTPTVVTSPLQSGRTTIRLSAPGAGNNGSVDLAVNLGAGASANACPAFTPAAASGNKAYLRGKWCGVAAARDPAVRIRFGVRRGGNEVMYNRELY